MKEHSHTYSYCIVLKMAEREELELEDFIEIAEEADLIQAERIIEDNTGPRGGRDGVRKGDMEEAVRAVEELMLAMNLDKVEIMAEQSKDGFEVKLGGNFPCGGCNVFDNFNQPNRLRPFLFSAIVDLYSTCLE